MRKSIVLYCTLGFFNRSLCTVNGTLSVPPSLMWYATHDTFSSQSSLNDSVGMASTAPGQHSPCE